MQVNRLLVLQVGTAGCLLVRMFDMNDSAALLAVVLNDNIAAMQGTACTCYAVCQGLFLPGVNLLRLHAMLTVCADVQDLQTSDVTSSNSDNSGSSSDGSKAALPATPGVHAPCAVCGHVTLLS